MQKQIKSFTENNMDRLIAAYQRGCENKRAVYDEYESQKKERSKNLILYYISICLLCKRRVIEKEVTILNGISQRNNIDSKNLPCHIYRGAWFRGIKDLTNCLTLASAFGFFERIAIFLQGLLVGIKIDSEEPGTWLDFYFLVCFLLKCEISVVNARGHYDQNATWLGELSEIIGYKYNIYQHGVVSPRVHIPNTFHCDHAYVFDNYSTSIFRKFIVNNSDCQYEVIEFSPSVSFEKINKELGVLYVGLIEQTIANWVDELINIFKEYKNVKVYIMKHPLSKHAYNDELNIIVTDSKIINLDMIITANSTLILDYIRAGYTGRIFVTDDKNAVMFSDYEEVQLINKEGLSNLIKTREGLK